MKASEHETAARLDTHEAVCAERYLGINGRLKRLEGIMIASAGTTIVTLCGIIVALVKLGA